ncbi:N-acetylmuramoyl-L-alanine amidase [Peribacillus asahii]|uniref:N-acetylmuramoyl-L-alanine amidase family protein n=1 Tax=Peribacillus asahii TaxID=228899 RepID=UPI0038309CCD
MVKIFIDAGHGGKDSGAVGNGLLEKDLTLRIAKRVKQLLAAYENVEVKMSRTKDTYPSLAERTKAANVWGADFFLSIHINAGGGVGYEDFVYPGSSKSIAYQNVIHSEMVKQIDMKDRGKKQGNLHVLRESNMPAILTECGFIDNKDDAAKLKGENFIEAIAKGHVNGLVKAFDLKEQKADDDCEYYIVVLKGDTVSKLAKKYDTTIAKIKSWNQLDDKYTIRIDQKLRVK